MTALVVGEVVTSATPQLILFDGVCNLCNGFVQFVIARDPHRAFHFGALQSASARRLLGLAGAAETAPDSIVLVADGGVYTRSSAVLRIARRLTFPWPLAFTLMVVPRPIRDWVYGIVARHRYAWFGQRDRCMVPNAEIRSRFLVD